MKKKVLVILGPTASGKSGLAVKLAKKFDGEIISADSRQVYKGLDVGTGKITKQEMKGICHHLLDVADPKTRFTVAEYKTLATNSLRYIVTNSKLPIVTGGTGLYINALAGTVSFPDVPPNFQLRQRLEKKSAEELFKMLKKRDPVRAKSIDSKNKVRLIRALEIVEALGQVPTWRFNRQVKSPYYFIYIGLKPDNLDKRIYKRLLERLEPMIREAKKLIKLKVISYQRMHELGLEYRYIGMYLQNKISKEDLIEKLNTEIRHYAKRQITWFKRNKKIKWFTLSAVEGFKPTEFKKIMEYARMALLGL